MLSQNDYIVKSMDLNLFFLRIMMEHSLFLELAFTPKDRAFSTKAEDFRVRFGRLLTDAINIGNVSREALNSRQFFTQFTEEVERLTSYYTGVPIDTSITNREFNLRPFGMKMNNVEANNRLTNDVRALNRRALQLTTELAAFKQKVLENVLSCKMFTNNYPHNIEHILREARLYINLLEMLERRADVMNMQDLTEQEVFWNEIMEEHAEFIAGLLDPTEKDLIETARDFAKAFESLTDSAKQADRQPAMAAEVTSESLEETVQFRDFKANGTRGLIECKIRSIIVPLLGDHVLREANHYLCALGKCDNTKSAMANFYEFPLLF